MYNWIKDTKKELKARELSGEPMTYCLPVEKPIECHVCTTKIKPRKEIIWEFTGKRSIPFCDDYCWKAYWDNM